MAKNGYEHVSGQITTDQLGLQLISGVTWWNTAKAVHTRPHKHPHMELIFCLRGTLSYRIDGHGSVSVCEGSGVLIPKQTIHILGGGTDTPCERIGLHIGSHIRAKSAHSVFDASDIRHLSKTLAEMAGKPFRLNSCLLASVRELGTFLKRVEPLSSVEQGYIRCLCCSIVFHTVAILRKPLIAPQPQMMDAAVEFINQHYGENFHIEDLIHFIGYGRTRLFALFKQHTGLTPNEYLVRLRIRKAKERRDQGMTDAAAVAKSVGFHDTSYFKNVYLRYTGSEFPSCGINA